MFRLIVGWLETCVYIYILWSDFVSFNAQWFLNLMVCSVRMLSTLKRHLDLLHPRRCERWRESLPVRRTFPEFNWIEEQVKIAIARDKVIMYLCWFLYCKNRNGMCNSIMRKNMRVFCSLKEPFCYISCTLLYASIIWETRVDNKQ